ncbi:Uncharacterised protein [Mycobacterium tuberculosis]|nr:Uncharacterised protein [Mycobacterium tuberculosis]
MDPGAPLKVKCAQVGVGARRITIPAVRCAVTMSSREPTPAASMSLFRKAGMTADGSRTKNVMEFSRGVRPHQRGLRVSTIR